MTWEDEQNPWGKKKGPQTPEELIASVINKIKKAFEGGGTGGGTGGEGGEGGRPAMPAGGLGKLVTVIAIVLLFSMAVSTYYSISPREQGVVLRFGKFVKKTNPGPHLKIPMIDDVYKVNVKKVRTENFGFRTTKAAQRSQFAKRGFEEESLMLTADRNVIDVEWIVRYTVKDAADFLFKVRDVPQAVRDLSEMTMRRIVGNMDFDYVLSNREILAGAVRRELQEALDGYESGVDVKEVQLQDVNPPDAVKPAFNEVNEADQDMKRLVNEAEEAYNRQIPKASGTAKQILEEAEGYAVQRINKAKGDTARFVAILKEYKKARVVTRKRMYLETMQEILPEVENVYVVDKEQKGILPLLNLNKGKK